MTDAYDRMTPRAKKVLQLSLREALQLGCNYVGTEHILLGLIREGEGVGAKALGALNIELTHLRQAVIKLLMEPPNPVDKQRQLIEERKAALTAAYAELARLEIAQAEQQGCPAYVGLDTARHFAAKFFEWDLLNGRYPNYPSIDEIRAELAGRDVACWCPPRRIYPSGNLGDFCCHGDVLLELANA